MTLACGAAKLGLGLATALPTVLLQLFEVFGVFRYVVQQRTREIGIRMALGARPRQLVALVVVSGGRALAIGLAIGLAGAFGASAILRGSLHGLSALDPGAYVGAASILAITGVVALYLPARRATRVEPTSALRCE
jgi:ABC-type antimicrobial peptide transport system permease subunit